MEESLLKQFKEEAGDEPIHTARYLMLRQKYGLVPPQLSLADHNLIQEEEFYANIKRRSA